MSTSFISEHTAEYFLIPKLINALSREGRNVIPFYFWRSREGSNISQKCDRNQKIRLLAMYPRRPKINVPMQDAVLVKFNEVIFNRAKYLQSNGIPTIAGVPLVSSLFNLSLDCPCAWFVISQNLKINQDYKLTITISSNSVVDEDSNLIIKPHYIEDIVEYYEENSLEMTWQKAIEILKGSGDDNPYFYHYFGVRYKPVYFLIQDKM
ncbi:MAG: hypothetical protein P9X24_11265 [Candidatus Hatepunaea meridiana]|nr:hypothetical protein [Candidatus Hatepunaea meridiana]